MSPKKEGIRKEDRSTSIPHPMSNSPREDKNILHLESIKAILDFIFSYKCVEKSKTLELRFFKVA